MALFIKEPKDYYTILFKNLREFQKWIDGLQEDKAPENAVVGIEASNGDVIFEHNFQDYLKRIGLKDSKGLRNKYAMSVGKNMAATNYAIDLFKEKYKPRHVFEITPHEKGRKISEKDLKINYGIEIKDASQDEIDSAVVCFKAMQKYKFQLKIKEAEKNSKKLLKSK
jgi:hypothetical protein